MVESRNGGAGARAWMRSAMGEAWRDARIPLALGVTGTVLAVLQAAAAAIVLAQALTGAAMSIWLLVGFAVLALARAGLTFASETVASRVGASARRRIRSDIFARLLAAGPAILRRSHSGELTSTVVDRVEALDGLFARYVPAAALAIAGPVVVLAAMLVVDPMAALILAGCGLLVPLGMAAAGLGAAAASRGQFLALARLQARFLDRIRGIATIVALGRQEDEARALETAARELAARTMRVLRVAFLSSAVFDVAMVLALVVLATRYAASLAAGTLAEPWMALFAMLLVVDFFAPLRGFAAAYQDRLHATGAADALAAVPPMPEPTPARPIRTVTAQGVTIAFDSVCLTWDPARGPALDGLSFRVPAGETLILAGPSGSGKSTVLEILLGFVTPDSGRVTINGAELSDLVPAALARLIAWIGQRPVLFAGTIRENIRFARPEATDDEVAEAARAARVDQFAADLPAGLDTRIGEGGYGLSGGQAQRVAIARAYLKNAPVLLLDEPTAHLDPATEAEVLDSLRRLALGRTVILASHSAAAHAFSGRRVDLREGRVQAERGAA